MVEESVITIVKKYIHSLNEAGIKDCYVVVFGSQATGNYNKWSDIDLLVVSSLFDGHRKREHINLFWHVAARVDSRIEPVPVGKRQYLEDDSSAIIEIARREGQVVLPAA